jgi:hypothetical protein
LKVVSMECEQVFLSSFACGSGSFPILADRFATATHLSLLRPGSLFCSEPCRSCQPIRSFFHHTCLIRKPCHSALPPSCCEISTCQTSLRASSCFSLCNFCPLVALSIPRVLSAWVSSHPAFLFQTFEASSESKIQTAGGRCR